jgi:hypothetical protein
MRVEFQCNLADGPAQGLPAPSARAISLAGGRISSIGAFVLSSIRPYLVVTGVVHPHLGHHRVGAAYGDKSLRQWAIKK